MMHLAHSEPRQRFPPEVLACMRGEGVAWEHFNTETGVLCTQCSGVWERKLGGKAFNFMGRLDFAKKSAEPGFPPHPHHPQTCYPYNFSPYMEE